MMDEATKRLLKKSGLVLALATLGLGSVELGAQSGAGKRNEDTSLEQRHALIGAKVIGRGARTLGFVEDLVLDEKTGEVAMYLVKEVGLFGNYGVIPIGNIESESSEVKDEETHYTLAADVNKATFSNIAKWDGEGPVGKFLREYRSILSTVYRMDASRLESGADNYALKLRNSASGLGSTE